MTPADVYNEQCNEKCTQNVSNGKTTKKLQLATIKNDS